MSPALDLVKDYSCFVIEFFEVIDMSAPHIYHSALLLSPRMSIVRGLYEQCVRPFSRVVHGLPESWDPISATQFLDDIRVTAVWSPCSRFIAIARTASTDILDAVTLNRLITFESPFGFVGPCLTFTPDGRFLTRFSGWGEVISWDIQTGGPVVAFQSGLNLLPLNPLSFTYSMDGNMIAVAYEPLPHNHDYDDFYRPRNRSYSIVIFNLSGTHIHTHHVPEACNIPQIWPHGQCFRFATIKQSLITIWEVAFTSTHGPAEVESLPVPDESADWKRFLFFPPLSRLAFVLGTTVQIWDARASKLLLKTGTSPEFSPPYDTAHYPPWGSFSFDGHLFACIVSTGVYIWKESPSGYILHQKFAFHLPTNPSAPNPSPDGESIIMSLKSTIQLWHTRDKILSSSDTPALDAYEAKFVLGFSLNELFAGFVQRRGNIVKILDLQSGDLLWVTDMDVKIFNLQMTENIVFAVVEEEVEEEFEGKIVSWNLPGENRTLESGANIKDSIQTIPLDHSTLSSCMLRLDNENISLSPDLSQIAIPSYTDSTGVTTQYLGVYDIPTGRCLGSIKTTQELTPVFNLDGHQIWDKRKDLGWEIVEDRSGTLELKSLDQTARPPGLFPFHSSRGYEVTEDGWVLSPARERLLWLPYRWRSRWTDRTWGGRFLALLHHPLSDVVILEFFE